MRYLTLLAFLFLTLSCNIPKEKKDPSKAAPKKIAANNKIRNGIQLEEKGLKVGQAFLLYEDGSLVPEENLVKVHEQLNLRLVIDSGYHVTNGKVKIGATEKVVDSYNNVIVEETDLFTSISEDISATDAEILNLKVSINVVVRLVDWYQLEFRVWDKNNKNEVSGSFRFNIKAN